MSLTIFLGLCIVGVDFLIYALFQWTYGEKRSAIARRIAAQRNAVKEEAGRPFVVSSRKIAPETQKRLELVRARMGKGGEGGAGGTFKERLA